MSKIIGWYGGKDKMAARILPLIPAHKTYVEVFGGGGSVLFAKRPSPVEVYNDLNKGLVNMWQVIRDEKLRMAMYEQCKDILYSEEEYADSKIWETLLWMYNEEYNKKMTNAMSIVDEAERLMFVQRITEEHNARKVECAALFFTAVRQSFSGTFQGWKRDTKDNTCVNTFREAIEAIRGPLAKRLTKVHIENLSFEDLMPKFDFADTFYYLDPPYVHDTRGESARSTYKHEMTNTMHENLVELMLKLKGKWMLAGYDHPVYDRLIEEGGAKKLILGEYAKTCKGGEGSKDMGQEVIWINYTPGMSFSTI